MVNTLKKFREDITRVDSQEMIAKTVGPRAQEFTTSLISMVSGNPSLQECTTQSLMNTALKATSLNLPIDGNLGFAYAIAYDNSKKEKRDGKWVTIDTVKEAQLQIGYKGFIQLAQRSTQYETINARDVREGEIIGEDFVSGEMQFKALPAAQRVKAKVVGYVAFFKLSSGFRKMLYMSVEELEEHAAKFSQTYKNDKKYHTSSSLWSKDFDSMAIKTVIKLLLSKYGPLSVQLQDAIKYDQAVIDSDGSARYTDNSQDKVEEVEVEVMDNANAEEMSDADEAKASANAPMGAQKEPDMFAGV